MPRKYITRRPPENENSLSLSGSYRVRELNGTFSIEIAVVKTKGVVLKSKYLDWVICDIYGKPFTYVLSIGVNNNSFKLQSFSTLDDAIDQIEKFRNPEISMPKYHYY